MSRVFLFDHITAPDAFIYLTWAVTSLQGKTDYLHVWLELKCALKEFHIHFLKKNEMSWALKIRQGLIIY